MVQRGRGAHLLSAYRAEDQSAFGAREKAELGVLLDHITLSLQSQWRWQEAEDLARAVLAHSDHDTNPLILVTADAEPIYRNPAAEHLLNLGAGLCLDGTRLVASSRADQRLLRETIARVAQGDPTDAAASPSVVTLACTPPAPSVVVVVRAAGQVFLRQAGMRRGLVMVTVRGGHARHDPASCVFARQYELTTAQAKVSALVLAGQPLSRVAQSLNVSENTVRSHLRQIFQKTETHGQMGARPPACARLPNALVSTPNVSPDLPVQRRAGPASSVRVRSNSPEWMRPPHPQARRRVSLAAVSAWIRRGGFARTRNFLRFACRAMTCDVMLAGIWASGTSIQAL